MEINIRSCYGDIKSFKHPKDLFMNVKIAGESYTFPSLILYNKSSFFKIYIDDDFKKSIIEFEDSVIEYYLTCISYNIEFVVELKDIILFLLFCDYVQIDENVYIQVLEFITMTNSIVDVYSNLSKIIHLLFFKIPDDKKESLFDKFPNKSYYVNILNDIKSRKELTEYEKEDLFMKFFNNYMNKFKFSLHFKEWTKRQYSYYLKVSNRVNKHFYIILKCMDDDEKEGHIFHQLDAYNNYFQYNSEISYDDYLTCKKTIRNIVLNKGETITATKRQLKFNGIQHFISKYDEYLFPLDENIIDKIMASDNITLIRDIE